VLGHVGITVPDLGAATHYYGAIMPLVGFAMYIDADEQFAYRPMAGKPGTYVLFYPSAEQCGARAAGLPSISAAVRRDVLARAVGRHARSGMPSRPRLSWSNEIRCANPIRPMVPA
jgi:hypothetical protein